MQAFSTGRKAPHWKWGPWLLGTTSSRAFPSDEDARMHLTREHALFRYGPLKRRRVHLTPAPHCGADGQRSGRRQTLRRRAHHPAGQRAGPELGVGGRCHLHECSCRSLFHCVPAGRAADVRGEVEYRHNRLCGGLIVLWTDTRYETCVERALEGSARACV